MFRKYYSYILLASRTKFVVYTIKQTAGDGVPSDKLIFFFKVAIVVGGGNIFRGASWAGCSGLDRASADYIGYDNLKL